MLGPDEIADLEGDARCLLNGYGLPLDEPTDVIALAIASTGHAPEIASMRQEACLARVRDTWRIFIRRGMPPARARFLVCHEVAEREIKRWGYEGADIEERANALGAALAAPRMAVVGAIREHAHRVTRLADALMVSQSVALLRVGEVTGRPVVLLRRPAPIVRGQAFEWPAVDELVRAVRCPPRGVHPLRITDEPGRWGLMSAAA